jgi:hypothetical protein
MQHSLKRFMLVCLMLAMSLTGLVTVINAQDEAAAGPVQGFFFVQATAGTLEEGEDETYLLTLEGVPDSLDWVVSTPEYFAGGYETAVVVSEWAANVDEPLSTTALLRLEDTTLRLIAGTPVYDPMAGTLTLQVSAVEAFPVEEDSKKKGSDIPDEFDAATLTLVLDDAFSVGLATGSEILAAEGRVSRSDDKQRPGAPRPKRP